METFVKDIEDAIKKLEDSWDSYDAEKWKKLLREVLYAKTYPFTVGYSKWIEHMTSCFEFAAKLGWSYSLEQKMFVKNSHQLSPDAFLHLMVCNNNSHGEKKD